MRKQLLGATALIAVATLGVQAAEAQDKADPIRLGMSGNMYGFFTVASQDDGIGPDGVSNTADDAPGHNRRSTGFSRRGRIHFTGSTTLDNGLKVGVQVRLNAVDCRDQIDQSYIWFDTQFGKLEYGKVNGVGDDMFIGVPNPVPHLGLNTPDILVVNQTNNAGNGTLAETPATIVYTSKRERVNYFTPKIYGIQLGVSYTPVNCAGGNGGSRPCGGSYAGQLQDDIARGYDIIETAATYENSFGPVDIGLYAAYFTSSNGDGITRTVGVGGTGEESQWGVSGQVGYQGLALGGGYRRSFDDGYNPDQDSWDWNVGLTYTTGPWEGGVMYANKKTRLTGQEDRFDGVAVGGSYLLGPGISLIAGVQYYDWGTNSSNPATVSFATNKAWSASFGTNVSF